MNGIGSFEFWAGLIAFVGLLIPIITECILCHPRRKKHVDTSA